MVGKKQKTKKDYYFWILWAIALALGICGLFLVFINGELKLEIIELTSERDSLKGTLCNMGFQGYCSGTSLVMSACDEEWCCWEWNEYKICKPSQEKPSFVDGDLNVYKKESLKECVDWEDPICPFGMELDVVDVIHKLYTCFGEDGGIYWFDVFDLNCTCYIGDDCDKEEYYDYMPSKESIETNSIEKTISREGQMTVNITGRSTESCYDFNATVPEMDSNWHCVSYDGCGNLLNVCAYGSEPRELKQRECGKE